MSTRNKPASKNVQETIDAIRTIAKTNELEHKIDKALQKKNVGNRLGLSAERITALQATNSAGISSSGSVSRDIAGLMQAVTSGSTNAVDAAINAANNALNSGSGITTNKSNNIDSAQSGGEDVQNAGNGLLSASDAAALAAILSTIQSVGESDGMNQYEIDAWKENARKDFLNDNSTGLLGVYRIGDLFTDGTTAWPTEGSGDGLTGAPDSPQIKALIAEIAGKTAVLLLRESTSFDFIPSLAASEDAGQNPWTSSDISPILPGWEDWELGYYGSADGPYAGLTYGNSYQNAFQNYLDASVGYQHPGFDYIVEDYRNAETPSMVLGGGDTVSVEFYLNWDDTGTPINTGWYLTNVNIDSIACGSPESLSYCPLEVPRESVFPTTGTIGLFWKDGRWQYKQYDSEAAAIVQTSISTLLLSDRGINYEMGPTIQGGWYATFTDQQAGTTPAMLIRPDGTVRDVIDKNLLPYYTGQGKSKVNSNGFIFSPHLI